MMEDIRGRVALVTGGSRGIGAAVAAALAAAGATVALTYREREAEASAVVQTIRAGGGSAEFFQVDVADRVAVRRLAEDVRARLGPIGILVNNAGIGVKREIDEITDDDWDRHLLVNVTSAFVLTQAVVPSMRERRWGRIINMSSVAAQTGGVIGPHYASSKAALIGLTHGYALRLVKEGITVNAIAPALIESEMVRGADPNRIPLGRLGDPDEVAELCVLLARNGYMTGQTISVNGGMYMTS